MIENVEGKYGYSIEDHERIKLQMLLRIAGSGKLRHFTLDCSQTNKKDDMTRDS